ncbi:hypothetical protein GCM10010149_50220 [Nonomuraea roseoviolacea subsp. roseoviolacea]|uniref:DUF6445 family protein n=1 Tax=Nonomuraea roseoviolacea TaxID=103837 RepID=UPI0031E47CA9
MTERTGPARISDAALPPEFFLRVMDDYYADPGEVRDFALAAEFAKPFTGSWAGTHSLQRHPRTAEVFHELARRTGIPGKPNWDEIERSRLFWGRPSAGVFALLLDGQRDSIHAHKRTGRWAAVCYLSAPGDCAGREGLRLFRHRPTGAFSCAGASREQLLRFRADAADPARWDLVHVIEMRFNRMVLFDGQYFHAASDGFGEDARTGRLAQLFAIDFDQS